MSSILVATTAAADLQFLSIEELRAAAGVADDSRDAELAVLGLRVAAAISDTCHIRPAVGSVPTLLRETLTETFRDDCGQVQIILSRRHEITVSSVVIDGITIDASGYEVDPDAGLLTRLREDRPTVWRGNKVTVAYAAGFTVVPDALKRAASEFLRHLWLEGTRDPSVKAREVEIVDIDRTRTEYWAGSIPGQGGDNTVPDFVAVQLARFRMWWA